MDKDKIIKALECCCESDSFEKPNCKDCPADCSYGLMSVPFIQQVLALLKEQEAVVGELKPQQIKLEERKVLADDSYDEPVYSIDKFFHCPRCNKILSRTYEMFDIRFCSNCGQAVQWD